jgi:chaperone modulatory protein CbpM
MIISREEFLVRARLDDETLVAWCAEEWLIPGGTPEALEFCDADVARADLIRDLKGSLGVNDEGVGIILNLIDQVHGLRRSLAQVLEARRQRP